MLTIQDLHNLRDNPYPIMRAEIAKKVCSHMEEAPQGSQEFRLACEIASVLQKDVHPIVRIALADGMKSTQRAPHQLIVMLAEDEDLAVAEPVLRHSMLLTEKDLLRLISMTHEMMRLIAIAEREQVSESISLALIEKKMAPVVLSLVSNEGAAISEEGYGVIGESFFNQESILHALMGRKPMPADTVRQMMDRGGAVVAFPGPRKNAVKIQSFSAVSKESVYSDITMLLALGAHPDERQCAQVVDRMNIEGKLSAPMMMLSLCLGHKEFFAASMAKQTGAPYAEAFAMCNGSEADFRKLYNKSRLSSVLFKLFAWEVAACNETLASGLEPCSEAFLLVMASKLIEAESSGINFSETMGRPIAEAMLEHATHQLNGEMDAVH